MHEAHHNAYNAMQGFKCYSMYPSEKQTPHPDAKIEVFKLRHQIPICESMSPVSSYRWHSMSTEEFEAYQTRLETAVYKQMAHAENLHGTSFSLAMAHHAFLNPLVMQNVLRRRAKEGKPRCPLICFVHGTALRMYHHEKDQQLPDEFPLRFLPLIEKEGVFNSWEEDGVQVCYMFSQRKIQSFSEIFPRFPQERVVILPNGINQQIFHPEPNATIATVLSDFFPWYYEGSSRRPAKAIGENYEHVVVMVGRLTKKKRIQGLLYAAKEYEKSLSGTATIIVGNYVGPEAELNELQDLAYEELNLQHTFFLGRQPQTALAYLYTMASVGVFPAYKQPFGMVLLECMACGTPVSF